MVTYDKFEEQVANLLRTPGISHAVIKASEGFVAHARGQERARSEGLVRQWRADAKEKAKVLGTDVKRIHERLEQIADDAKNGTRSYEELLDERARLKTELGSVERKHQALVTSEEHYKVIEADPDAYNDRFYRDFPGLADRRITLGRYLAEQGAR